MPSDLADLEVRPLWEAVAQRLAQGEDPAALRTITARLSRAGEALVCGWLRHTASGRGRPPVLRSGPRGTAVPVQQLLRALDRTPADLRGLVEQAGVQIHDRHGPRLHARGLRTRINAHTANALPDTPLLRARLLAVGVTDTTLDERLRLTDALATVRSLLPLSRPVSLARLGHDAGEDPHLFDLTEGRHGDKLVLLARDLLGAPTPQTPAQERALLARLGITADRLSQTVMALHVRACGTGPTDRALNQAHADNRPHHLTLYDVTEHPPRFDARTPWTVVENPSLMEEALQRGTPDPLVCTSGALTAVDHTLLCLARDQGVPLHYSGDLDPAGHTIAAAVQARYNALVQHMDSATRQHAAGFVRRRPADPEAITPDRISPAAGSGGEQDALYQEHPAVLDLLLGSCGDDPLAGLWHRAAAAPAHSPPRKAEQAEAGSVLG